MADRDITLEIGATVSSDKHCSNNCPHHSIQKVKINPLGSNELKDAYEARCLLFRDHGAGTRLSLDRRRKNHPWRRCKNCRWSETNA